jgi:hypothetical protein
MTERCLEPEVGERIAAYELGLLNPPERREIEAHVLVCEPCREDMAASADVATILTGDPRGILSDVRRLAAGHAIRRALPRGLATPRVLVPVFAAAATVMFFVLRQPAPPSLARIEPLPYLPLITRDARDEDATAVYFRAMDRYAQGDYARAAALLETALSATPPLSPEKRDQASVFRGVCLLLERRTSDAIEPLEDAAASELPVVADRARWYLAQARLTMGETARAESLLALLATSPGYAGEAEEQLRRLRAWRR